MEVHTPHNPAGKQVTASPDAACGCENYEKKFRRQNLFHSFMAAMYSTVGAAVGFGVLNNVVGLLLPHAAGAGATAAATATATGAGSVAAAGFFAAISPYLAMAALVVVGVAAIYMAQREYTTLNCIQGERQARINAEALRANAKSQEKTLTAHEHHPHEHHAHTRSDGRNWAEATQPSMAAERAI